MKDNMDNELNIDVENRTGENNEPVKDINEKMIFDAITNVSDEYVDEAARVSLKRVFKSRKTLSVIAACLICAIVLPIAFLHMPDLADGGGAVSDTSATSATTIDYTVTPVDDDTKSLTRSIPNDCLIESVTALETSGRMVEASTSFLLKTAVDVSVSALKELIAFEPQIPFELEKNMDGTFNLVCGETLPTGSIVKLSLRDEYGDVSKSWAFQTTDVYKITSTLPADLSKYVPMNTGIEMSFSQPTEASELEKHFEISPDVSGKFQKIRSTLIFIPDDELSSDTVYTVTVKAGLTSIDGGVLAEDRVFRFRTTRSDNYYCYLSNAVTETFLPDDPALIEFYCSAALQKEQFEVKLYKYADADAYYNALKDYESNTEWEETHTLPTEGLSEVYSTIDTPLTGSEGGYGYAPSFFILPDDLEPGYYIAEITASGGNYKMQKLIQINSISVYSSILPGQTVFFLNDAKTGQPAAGALVSLAVGAESFSAVADGDGIAMLDITEAESDKGVLKIEYSDEIYIDLFAARAEEEKNLMEDYYLYIYTDREQYLTTDTINVWGVVLPRNRNAVMPPPDLTITLGDNANDGTVKPVTLNPDGTFITSFSYENHRSMFTSVRLDSASSVLGTKGVNIRDYAKPVYVIELDVPEISWLPQENPIKVGINTTFYDGTPAADVVLNVNGSGSGNISVTTDKNGDAGTELTIEESYSNTWRPTGIYTSVDLGGNANVYQSTYGYTYAFFRDTMLETEIRDNTLELRTSKVDISRLKNEADVYKAYSDYSMIRGEAADTELSITLIRNWTEKYETSTFYDFILKQNVKTYNYTDKQEILGNYTVTTSNGTAILENLPLDYEDSYYEFKINYNDTQGRKVVEEIYHSQYYYNNHLTKRYFAFQTDSRDFTEDQTLKFEIYENLRPYHDENGRLFYAFNSFDFITANVNGGTDFSHTMTGEYIPNVYVSGAYFDGKHVYPVGGIYLSFNPKEREIKVSATKDKEKYAPGDDVSITVTAKSVNGEVMKNTSVSLSLVDEAAFAVSPQTADPLETIYTDFPLPYVMVYHSYIQHSIFGDPGAEKGGGGPDGTRRDFKDTAAFLTGLTDENGEIVFNIKLPDNLTTWRATIQAAGEDSAGKLCAGTLAEPVVATLPFFVVPVVLPEYLVGDDFTVSATTAGGDPEKTAISATLTGDGYEKTIDGAVGENLEFGKLAKGEYKIHISASDGEHYDAVELPVAVKETLLESPVTRTFLLSDGVPDVEPARYPVSITFTDNEYKLYGKLLAKLYSRYGTRADFRIANTFASLELGYIDEEYYKSTLAGIASDGLATMLPYSEADFVLTSLICAAAPEILNIDLTAEHLYAYMNSTDADSETVTSCLMGLAALSKPFLPEIYDLLENPDGLGYSDKLRLCAALALAGDYDGAEKYYTELTADDFTIYYNNYFDSALAYVGKNSSDGGTIANTSLALITASVLNLPEAEAMAMYLVNTPTSEQTVVLEVMTYLKNYVPKTTGDAVFSYTLDGRTETVTLERFRGKTISFGKEQFENADFKVVSGDVSCNLFYIGSVDEQESKPTIKFEKEVKEYTGSSTGSLLQVKLSLPPSTPAGYYCIEDIIPSGARYAGSSSYHYIEQSGQRISAGMYFHNNVGMDSPIVYYIRLVTTGEYVMENAVVCDAAGNWGTASGGSTLVIEK